MCSQNCWRSAAVAEMSLGLPASKHFRDTRPYLWVGQLTLPSVHFLSVLQICIISFAETSAKGQLHGSKIKENKVTNLLRWETVVHPQQMWTSNPLSKVIHACKKTESTANKQVFHFEFLKTTRSVMKDMKNRSNKPCRHFYMCITLKYFDLPASTLWRSIVHGHSYLS